MSSKSGSLFLVPVPDYLGISNRESSLVLATIRPAVPTKLVILRQLAQIIVQALALVQLAVPNCRISQVQDLVLHAGGANKPCRDIQATPAFSVGLEESIWECLQQRKLEPGLISTQRSVHSTVGNNRRAHPLPGRSLNNEKNKPMWTLTSQRHFLRPIFYAAVLQDPGSRVERRNSSARARIQLAQTREKIATLLTESYGKNNSCQSQSVLAAHYRYCLL